MTTIKGVVVIAVIAWAAVMAAGFLVAVVWLAARWWLRVLA